MTCNLLISWRKLWYVFLPNLKIRHDDLRLFAYGFPPKGIAILPIKCLCLLHWLGDLYTKLLRSNPILWLQIYNDTVALCQHMPDPPCKCRVTFNTELYRIFGHLHRVLVLHILEGHPFCAIVLPMEEDFNPLFCLSATLCSGTCSGKRVLLLYFSTVITMVENILE